MPVTVLSEKKVRRIGRLNEVVKDYFDSHPDIDIIAARHLMPLLIRKGIFLKDTENGLPVRVLLRELHKGNLLHLISAAAVVISKRSYYFQRQTL